MSQDERSPSPSKQIPDCNPYSKPHSEKLQKVFIPSAPEKSVEIIDDSLLDNIDLQNISVIKGPLITQTSGNDSQVLLIQSSNKADYQTYLESG